MTIRKTLVLPNGHVRMPRLGEGSAVDSLNARLDALDAVALKHVFTNYFAARQFFERFGRGDEWLRAQIASGAVRLRFED